MSHPTYPSKVDAWLVAVLAAAIGFTLLQGVWLRSVSPSGSAVAFGAAAFVILLLLLVAVPCRYTLEPDHLLIQAGLTRRRIAYRDITAIAPSRNPLSSPALSLRRVKVSYGGRFLLVSPRERERFIQELRERVAADGGRLG
ncbi:MAG TPA: PH domain-containing protein [Thermoanaerobaculia bacterium]|nr:PH domain-containing protein [Thermoanaerobaculia bacterium]